MAYCRNCGNEIHDEAVICTTCGVSQRQVEDNGGIGWGLLSYFVPIAGIILFLIWKDEKPKTAKACIIGSIINLSIGMLMIIIFWAIIIIFGVTASTLM